MFTLDHSYALGRFYLFILMHCEQRNSTGNGICCLFNKPTISYFTTSIECSRPDYFGEGNYYRQMCDEFYPILDDEKDIAKRGGKDYTELVNKVKEMF